MHLKSGAGTLAGGHGRADGAGRLDGRRGEAGRAVGTDSETTVTFTVTPSAAAAVNTNFKVSALLTSGAIDGLHGQRRPDRPAGRGPVPPLGQLGRVRQLARDTAPQARRLGRSAAIQTTGVGETFTLPVDVHNWSATRAERDGQPDAAGRRHRRRDVASRTGRSRRAPTRRSTSASRTRSRTRRCRSATRLRDAAEHERHRPDHDDVRRRHRVRGPDARHRPEDDDPGGRGARRRSTGPRAPASTPARRSTSAASGSRAAAPATARRPASTAARSGAPGDAEQHVREGHALRRRPLLLHPRPRRLPELRGRRPRSASRTGWRTRSRS